MIYMPTKINKLRKMFKELPEDKKEYLYELRDEVINIKLKFLHLLLYWLILGIFTLLPIGIIGFDSLGYFSYILIAIFLSPFIIFLNYDHKYSVLENKWLKLMRIDYKVFIEDVI